MELYAIFSALSAFIFLQMGFYVLRLDRKSPVNAVFSISSLLLFAYSVFYVFFFSATEKDSAMIYLKLGSIGWILTIATCLHFVLLLTRFRPARKWWFIIAMYLPFFVLLFFSLTRFFYATDLIRVNGIWFAVIHTGSVLYQLYVLVLALSVAFSVIRLVLWTGKTDLYREKKQGRVILVTFLVSITLIVVNNFLLYNLKIYIVPDIAHFISLINTMGALIAITRYKMMQPSQALLNAEVLSSIDDFLVLLDDHGKIVNVNRRMLDVLGYRPDDLEGKPVGIVLFEESLAVSEIVDHGRGIPDRRNELHLITREGEQLPVQAVFKRVRDPISGSSGLVIICHDRASEIALGEETHKRILAEAGEKKQSDYLQFLSKTALNFIELHDEDNIYQLIGQKIRELTYDSLGIVASYNEYLKQFQAETVSGNQSIVSVVNEILGGSMEKVILKLNPEAVALLENGKLIRYSGRLYDMLSGMLPEKKCEQIEKDLGLKDIYLMGFTRSGKLLGGLVLFTHADAQVVNRAVVEAFIGQASIAIQRRKAEELLLNNENLYRRLMETAFDAVVVHRMGKILYANERAAKLAGLAGTKEMTGRLLMDFVHPDSREAVKERMKDMYEKGVAVPLLEEKFITDDGRPVDVEVTATGFMYLDTPAVMVVFRDIGQRKKMEAGMRELQRQIEFILGATKTGLDIIDSQFHIVFIDPEWKKTYGEPAGKKCYDYFMDRKQICPDCDLVKAMESKKILVHEEELIKEHRWVQVTTIPYQGSDNEWYYAETNVDITERKKIEKELMLALREIEVLNQKLRQDYNREVEKSREKDYIIINQSRLSAMSEMLQNISHHWKGPLNNIGLLMQNIMVTCEEGTLDPKRMEDYRQKGLDLLYGMTRTLDDFTNFLKSDRVKQSFGLREAVEKAVSLAQLGFREADIRIELDMDEDVFVKGLMNETTQIVVNLLNNAREAVVDKNVANAFVKIAVFRENGHPVLTVTDNGRGIPDELLPRVFEPYFTTRAGKSGIGLYLSKEFLEKDMDAKIELMNTGDGLQVKIVFPK